MFTCHEFLLLTVKELLIVKIGAELPKLSQKLSGYPFFLDHPVDFYFASLISSATSPQIAFFPPPLIMTKGAHQRQMHRKNYKLQTLEEGTAIL